MIGGLSLALLAQLSGNAPATGGPPPAADALLLESGDDLLLETGDRILLE